MTRLTRDEWIARRAAKLVHPTRFVLNPEYYAKVARRLYARNQIHLAVRRGAIVKPSECSACNRTNLAARDIHAHHTDYRFPLIVRWLCRWCHESLHTVRKSSAAVS